jgi:hypothetical protein
LQRLPWREPVRWVVERGEDDRALVDCQREQRHTAIEGKLEAVG